MLLLATTGAADDVADLLRTALLDGANALQLTSRMAERRMVANDFIVVD